ncbi:MAG: putative peroxidase-related enzyme [Cellvibrionaceae bacterium]
MNDEMWVEQMKVDYKLAKLTDADRAMLDYVTILTVAPAKTQESDILNMRENGLSDESILEINQITGFFAWCNRIVDGLGVELEDFWEMEGISNI